MYLETIDRFSDLAEKKAGLVNDNPFSFFVGAMMAGACTPSAHMGPLALNPKRHFSAPNETLLLQFKLAEVSLSKQG